MPRLDNPDDKAKAAVNMTVMGCASVTMAAASTMEARWKPTKRDLPR